MLLICAALANPTFTPTEATSFNQWTLPSGYTWHDDPLTTGYRSGAWYWYRGMLTLEWPIHASTSEWVTVEVWGGNARSSTGVTWPVPSYAVGTGHARIVHYGGVGGAVVLASTDTALGGDLSVRLVPAGSLPGAVTVEVLDGSTVAWSVALDAAFSPIRQAPDWQYHFGVSALPGVDWWTNRLQHEGSPLYRPRVDGPGGATWRVTPYYTDEAQTFHHATALDVTSDWTAAAANTATPWAGDYRRKIVDLSHYPDTLHEVTFDTGAYTGEPGVEQAWRIRPASELGRVAVLANGRQAVLRGGSVWLRDGDADAWRTAYSPEVGGVPLAGLTLAQRPGDRLLVTDGTHTWQSSTCGTTWLPDGLADNLAALTTDLGQPLADLLLNQPDGVPLAAWVVGDALHAAGVAATSREVGAGYDFGMVSVWFDRLASGEPTLLLGPDNGRWQAVGPTCDTEWSRLGELATPSWLSTGFEVAPSGLQVLAGWVDGAVQVCWRPSREAEWSELVSVTSSAEQVSPYVVRRRSGGWEVGWLNADTSWTLYRADRPDGSWSLA